LDGFPGHLGRGKTPLGVDLFIGPPDPIQFCFLFFSGAAAAWPVDMFHPTAAAPLKNKKLREDTMRSYKQGRRTAAHGNQKKNRHRRL
jgi:hypothetical protein